jgi:hypothetical protein
VSIECSDDFDEVLRQVLDSRFISALKILPDSAAENFEDFEVFLEGLKSDPESLADLDLGTLAELDLSYAQLDREGAEGLAAMFRTDRLRALDLRFCWIQDAGLAALAACPQLRGLRRLHLQRNNLSAEGVRALHQLPELTELDLRYNPVGPEGAQALLAAPFAGSLTRLWLYGSDVGKDGVQMLAQAAELPVELRNLWRCV